MKTGRYSFLWRGLAFLASLLAIGYLVHLAGGREWMDQAWIDREVAGHGVRGELLFLAAGALFTAVGLPRQVVAFFGGYAFGLAWGTVLALAASLLGALGAYLYAHGLGRPLLAPRLGGRARRLHDLLQAHPFSLTLLIRLLPVGSNLLANLLAGLAAAPLGWFLLGSALGYLPQTLVFALAGSGLELGNGWRIGLSVVLFVASGLLGVQLYRHYRQRRQLDVALQGDTAAT